MTRLLPAGGIWFGLINVKIRIHLTLLEGFMLYLWILGVLKNLNNVTVLGTLMNNNGLLPENVEGYICDAGNEAPVLFNTSRKNAWEAHAFIYARFSSPSKQDYFMHASSALLYLIICA